MEKQFLAAAAMALFAAGPVGAQNIAPANLAIDPNSTCEHWGLSTKDLTDCREQWRTAATDIDRQRVRSAYQNRGTLGGTPLGSPAPVGRLNGPGPGGSPLPAANESPAPSPTPPISGNDIPPATPSGVR
jgi:hypothetical protein